MKKTVIILLLAFVILHPVSLSAALSLEALEMVEQLRRNLQENRPAASEATKVAESNQNEYVVGKELKAALSRLRQKVYGDAQISEKASDALTLQDRTENIKRTIEEETVPQLYIAGSELREAIARVRATRDPAEINNDVYYSPDDPPAPGMLKNPEPVSIAATEKISSPQKDSLQLKLHQNDSVKADEKPAEISVTDSEPEDSEKAHEEMQNRALNRQISKREFKMPKNYRIIVR